MPRFFFGPHTADDQRLTAGFPFVSRDQAVLEVDDAVSVLGDVVLVGDEHDGVSLGSQAVKHRHDFGAGLRVEVAGGFVGEND